MFVYVCMYSVCGFGCILAHRIISVCVVYAFVYCMHGCVQCAFQLMDMYELVYLTCGYQYEKGGEMCVFLKEHRVSRLWEKEKRISKCSETVLELL